MELAKAYFSQATKLNPNNIRALYGLLLVSLWSAAASWYTVSQSDNWTQTLILLPDDEQHCDIAEVSRAQEKGGDKAERVG